MEQNQCKTMKRVGGRKIAGDAEGLNNKLMDMEWCLSIRENVREMEGRYVSRHVDLEDGQVHRLLVEGFTLDNDVYIYTYSKRVSNATTLLSATVYRLSDSVTLHDIDCHIFPISLTIYGLVTHVPASSTSDAQMDLVNVTSILCSGYLIATYSNTLCKRTPAVSTMSTSAIVGVKLGDGLQKSPKLAIKSVLGLSRPLNIYIYMGIPENEDADVYVYTVELPPEHMNRPRTEFVASETSYVLPSENKAKERRSMELLLLPIIEQNILIDTDAKFIVIRRGDRTTLSLYNYNVSRNLLYVHTHPRLDLLDCRALELTGKLGRHLYINTECAIFEVDEGGSRDKRLSNTNIERRSRPHCIIEYGKCVEGTLSNVIATLISTSTPITTIYNWHNSPPKNIPHIIQTTMYIYKARYLVEPEPSMDGIYCAHGVIDCIGKLPDTIQNNRVVVDLGLCSKGRVVYLGFLGYKINDYSVGDTIERAIFQTFTLSDILLWLVSGLLAGSDYDHIENVPIYIDRLEPYYPHILTNDHPVSIPLQPHTSITIPFIEGMMSQYASRRSVGSLEVIGLSGNKHTVNPSEMFFQKYMCICENMAESLTVDSYTLIDLYTYIYWEAVAQGHEFKHLPSELALIRSISEIRAVLLLDCADTDPYIDVIQEPKSKKMRGSSPEAHRLDLRAICQFPPITVEYMPRLLRYRSKPKKDNNCKRDAKKDRCASTVIASVTHMSSDIDLEPMMQGCIVLDLVLGKIWDLCIQDVNALITIWPLLVEVIGYIADEIAALCSRCINNLLPNGKSSVAQASPLSNELELDLYRILSDSIIAYGLSTLITVRHTLKNENLFWNSLFSIVTALASHGLRSTCDNVPYESSGRYYMFEIDSNTGWLFTEKGVRGGDDRDDKVVCALTLLTHRTARAIIDIYVLEAYDSTMNIDISGILRRYNEIPLCATEEGLCIFICSIIWKSMLKLDSIYGTANMRMVLGVMGILFTKRSYRMLVRQLSYLTWVYISGFDPMELIVPLVYTDDLYLNIFGTDIILDDVLGRTESDVVIDYGDLRTYRYIYICIAGGMYNFTIKGISEVVSIMKHICSEDKGVSVPGDAELGGREESIEGCKEGSEGLCSPLNLVYSNITLLVDDGILEMRNLVITPEVLSQIRCAELSTGQLVEVSPEILRKCLALSIADCL